MILYSKYNNHRKQEFRLITQIKKEAKGDLFFAKKAQNQKANYFLRSLFKKYDYLKKNNFSFFPVPPIESGNDNSIIFEYKKGKTLDRILFELLKSSNEEKFKEFLEKYGALIRNNGIKKEMPESGFKEWFGDLKQEMEFVQVGCLDLNFDNIILDEEKDFFWVIDYEWVFKFPIPYKFIIFRALSSFYFSHIDHNPNRLIKLKELYKFFKISEKEKKDFIVLEYNFQKKVNADFALDSNDFLKRYEGIEEIRNNNQNFVLQKNEILIRKDQEIAQKDQALKDLNELILQKNQALTRKDQQLAQKDQVIAHKDQVITQKDQTIELMQSSKFWHLRKRYLKLKSFDLRELKEITKEARRVIREKGLRRFFWCIPKYLIYGKDFFYKPLEKSSQYALWINKNEKRERGEIVETIEGFSFRPKISILTPVYNVDPKWLNKCINSVMSQSYPHWELCLYDDCSTNPETIQALKKWQGKDQRIKIAFAHKNLHISGASNGALRMATGEFVGLLDNDDELSLDALFEVVKVLNQNPNLDFIYSDEDKINTKGERSDPFFKPDWSPDLFLSQMYTCHLGVYRRSLLLKIGGFRLGYEGSQDYDLVLRLLGETKAEKIWHIPRILYHWRKIKSSMAENGEAKNYAQISAKKALADHLKRNKIKGKVLDGLFPGTYRVEREIKDRPRVSIIIPFKDKANMLKTCVGSILKKTSYSNYEIVLVDNRSSQKETLAFLKDLAKNPIFKIIRYKKSFNYSAINNFAAPKAGGEYLLFLNNDTEVISPEWLTAMLEQIQRKEVGAVGAKLLYSNNTIQHAGVIMGLGGVAGHAHKSIPEESPGYFSRAALIQNFSACTAACLMVKKQLFQKVGGFNEKELKIAFNDVDLCLKIRREGFLIVFTPYAKLYHYESLSRGTEDCKEKQERFKKECDYMLAKWKKEIKNDPYYNPNLTRKREDFGIRIED